MGNEVDVSWEKHVGFKYWDLNEWKSWAKQDVKDLFCASDAVIRFYEYIKSEHGGKTLADLGSIAKIYYGGIGKEGDLRDGKVAAYEYMRDLFGVNLTGRSGGSSVNGRDVLIYAASINTLDEALRTIFVEFSEDSEFMRFVRSVKNLAGSILEKLEIVPDCSSKDFDPESILSGADTARQEIPRLVNSFFEALAKFLPQASPQMFFAFSTRVLPERTANKIYPSLTSDENNGLRQRLGVELGNWIENCDEIECKPINVYRHVDGGLLDLIWRLGCLALCMLDARGTTFSKYAPTVGTSFWDWWFTVFRDVRYTARDSLRTLFYGIDPMYDGAFAVSAMVLHDGDLRIVSVTPRKGDYNHVVMPPISFEEAFRIMGYILAMGYHNFPRSVRVVEGVWFSTNRDRVEKKYPGEQFYRFNNSLQAWWGPRTGVCMDYCGEHE